MNKVPYIERAYGDTGLTGECAYLWAMFLANEADMEDDYIAYDKFKSMAEQLAPQDGKPIPASVHFPALEEAIAKYTDKAVQYIDCSDPPDMDKSGSLEDRQPEWSVRMSGEYVYPGSDPQE